MNYQESVRLLSTASRVTVGASQTLSKQAARFVEGAFPAFLRLGDGCRVWDVDDHDYLDWVMGLAAVTLGYQHPAVDEAIQRQLYEGIVFSLPHRLEAQVAERLVEIIPCAQQVRFVKTGSEADVAAVSIARMATGRDIILYCGYHGWHGDYPVTKAEHPGVPELFGSVAKAFPYNDLEPLETFFIAYPNQIAAVMMEPMLFEGPTVGFLQGVRTLCTHCKQKVDFNRTEDHAAWDALVAPWKSNRPAHVYKAVGCLECRMTGFMGRVGIYEVLLFSSELKTLVAGGADLEKLRDIGFKEGMKPLRISGAMKVAAGMTTVDEVLQTAPPPTGDRRQHPR